MRKRAALAGAFALTVLVACGSSRDKSARGGAAGSGAAIVDDGGASRVGNDDAAADVSIEVKDNPIPNATRQLIIGLAEGYDSTSIRLALFDRKDSTKAWSREDTWFDATVGRNGVAWGRGLHGDGAVSTGAHGATPPPHKFEGDGRAPLGLFRIAGAFGSSPRPPITKMGYTTMLPTHRCVDDDKSTQYNRIVDQAKVASVDWDSAEDMLTMGKLYEFGMVIEHNAGAVPRGGSCIFFHVWGGPGDTTAGCTAMDKAHLTRLIESLEPEAQPLYLLLTNHQYELLAPKWGLPTL